jgi:acetamidase/formamidase
MVDHTSATYGTKPVEAYVLANLAVCFKIGEFINAPKWIVSFYRPLPIFG